MCKLNEDMVNEAAVEAAEMKSVEIALKMLKRGKLSYEEISEDSGLTIEDVKELAETQGSSANE